MPQIDKYLNSASLRPHFVLCYLHLPTPRLEMVHCTYSQPRIHEFVVFSSSFVAVEIMGEWNVAQILLFLQWTWSWNISLRVHYNLGNMQHHGRLVGEILLENLRYNIGRAFLLEIHSLSRTYTSRSGSPRLYKSALTLLYRTLHLASSLIFIRFPPFLSSSEPPWIFSWQFHCSEEHLGPCSQLWRLRNR